MCLLIYVQMHHTHNLYLTICMCIVKHEFSLIFPPLISHHMDHSSFLCLLAHLLPVRNLGPTIQQPYFFNCSIKVYMYTSIRIVNPHPYGEQLYQ